jgi:hypothetical protein
MSAASLFDQIDRGLWVIQNWVRTAELSDEDRRAVETANAYILIHLSQDEAEHERLKRIPRKGKEGESNHK